MRNELELAADKSTTIHTNPSEICNILTLRYNPKIKPLLPIKTWDRFQPDSTVLSIGDIENSILDSLKQKIESNKIKKISIALSGGIDSTLILAMLRKLFPDIEIEAITIKFAESVDESPVAAKIAQNFEANHHIVYLENYLEELPKAISIIKMPFWDLHWYHVVKKSQSLSKYLASGDGGDELFGGYTFRYKKFLSLHRILLLWIRSRHIYNVMNVIGFQIRKIFLMQKQNSRGMLSIKHYCLILITRCHLWIKFFWLITMGSFCIILVQLIHEY